MRDMRLPIDDVLPEVIDAARAGNVVLHAPTGAGKTTRVPPALLDVVHGQVVVLEPRRVAARAAALRMAEERGEPVGATVGYQVRFERRASAGTRLLVMTEGVLLRRLVDDPTLDGVGAVVFDEVHERALDADLAVAMARIAQRELRPDLRLVAMSATLDVGRVQAFLDARLVESRGRSFPVAVRYLPRPDDRELEPRVRDGVRAVWSEVDGDVLVFLPGAGEIARCAEALAGLDAEIVPLHGNLPPDAQDRALRPGRGRRVVLATNVAETSVTIPSVRAVVDSGLVRVLRHDAARGLDRLVVEPNSRASAEQRAGRAGRVAAGVCLRLWTEREHATRAAHDTPEVLRVDLAGPVLSLLAWGEPDPHAFPWFEPPPGHALDGALDLLDRLGARSGRGLTEVGRAMARIPAHPRLARLLVEAHRRGVLGEAASVAALLSDRLPFRRDGPAPRTDDDLEDLVEALAQPGAHGWRAVAPGAVERTRLAAAQLRDAAVRALGPPPAGGGAADVRRAVLAAWPDRVGRRRQADRYTLASGRGARLHPSSGVRETGWLVAVDVVDGDDAEARIHLATTVDPAWLDAPDRVEVVWDAERDRVVARRVARWGALELRVHEGLEAPREAVTEALVEAVRQHPERAVPTDDPALARLLGRLRFLARRRPDLALPRTDAAGLATVARTLAPGCRRLADLRARDWAGALVDALDGPARQALDSLAPERIEVPSGSRITLDWTEDGRPVLAVRIQEMFGCATTPRVVGEPVLLHLLAPNGRPQQVTDDLDGFWDRTWPEVRRELRARYPKHAWPEDPRAAVPQARPGRARTSADTPPPRRKP